MDHQTIAVKAMLLFFLFFKCYSANYREQRCQDRYGSDLTQNFALGRTASHISIFNNDQASRLTDGNTNPYFGNDSCSETDVGDDVSWQVQFASTIYITSVTVTTRADAYWPYSDYFQIKFMDGLVEIPSPCTSSFLSNNGETTTYACDAPSAGTGIKIVLPGTGKRLSLCEVQVHGRELEFMDNEVNYALRKPAKFTTVWNSQHAFYGVDGSRAIYPDTLCPHSDHESMNHWWKVDLGKNTIVYAVTVTNRYHYTTRLGDFEVFVSPSENVVEEKGHTCGGRSNFTVDGQTRTFFCKQPLRGRYVALVSRLLEPLNFCELSVQGQEEECIAPRPLGVESFRILDSQFSSSSDYGPVIYASHNGRLNNIRWNNQYGCWLPQHSDSNPWLQVDFLWMVTVTEIWTQGRGTRIIQYKNCWTKTYKVSYGYNGEDFQFYTENNVEKIFKGNWDADTIARNFLSPTIVARFVRIHPKEHAIHRALRVEFIGCYSGDEGYRWAKPLGMENHEITDQQLTVSSTHSNRWLKDKARLNHPDAWLSIHWADTNRWFQVDFILIATILEIWTQGHQRYVTKTYHVYYGYETAALQPYKQGGVTKDFSGNAPLGGATEVINSLSPAIVAQFIRIYVRAFDHYTALRLEFKGFYKESADPQPLGMQSGRILSSQISASYVFPHANYHPDKARLNWESNKCWFSFGGNTWWQVSFPRFVKVVQIQTQGRYGGGTYQNWVESYYISYGNDGINFYKYAQRGSTKIFMGNSDRDTVVTRNIDPAIVARHIRVHPVTWRQYIALNLEFIGFYLGYADSCENVPGRKPLGMQNFQIADSQISASSEYRVQMSPGQGRLGFFSSNDLGGGWAPLVADDNQWLQVDFLHAVKVTGLATQGRANYNNAIVKEYTVSFKQANDGDDVEFQFYKERGNIKVFTGNTDRQGIVRHYLDPYIYGRLLRVNPKTFTPSFYTIRVEFYGFEVALIDGDYTDVDNRITASSWMDHRHQPFEGVISGRPSSTSWTPAVEQEGEFIQVDLRQPTPLAGVELRGAADFPADSFTQLMMSYATTEENWKILKDRHGKTMYLLTSNCYQEFEKYVLARFVKFIIKDWGRRTSFRFQLHENKAYERTSAGIEEGIIMDDQLKSSNHPNDPHPAHEGRFNFPGAWCGNTMRNQLFLQVDFRMNFEVHALVSQGKYTDVMEYVTQYKLSSTLDEIHWNLYEEDGAVKLFAGNANCRCSKKNFMKPFLAKSLRVLPTTWVGRPCMRFDVFGVYKAILAVHARSGTEVDREGAVLTRQSSIKLNGKEVIDPQSGYNIVVANYITGELVTTLNTSDAAQMNDFLRNVSDHSVVVIATQNVTELPPDNTLQVLESLGATRIRYSMTSDHDSWILVGYKGKQQVNWITEKIGKVGEAIKVPAFVPLNERDIKPVYQEYFQNPSDEITDPDLTLEGHHKELSLDTISTCGANNSDCQEKLSLSMWMKNDVPKYSKETPSSSRRERFVFKYYSNGYSFIVPKHNATWEDARTYCQAIGADLVVIPDQHTLNFLADLSIRENLGNFFIGLKRHQDNLEAFRWVDGTSLVFSSWNTGEPSDTAESCVVMLTSFSAYNDVTCSSLKHFVCQQPIEDRIGLEPLGMENDFIPDSSIKASTAFNIYHDKFYARPNTQRNSPRSWCANAIDEKPFWQVDLGEIKSVCGVGTMGRGSHGSNYGYPISYSVQLSNDSFNWTFIEEGNAETVFKANEERNTMVINRFHRAFQTQLVKLNFLNWNRPDILCARMEIFACKEDEEHSRFIEHSEQVDAPLDMKENIPEDCFGVLMSGRITDGIYMINPGHEGAFPVYCDQTTDGGGWTVIQRRTDGAVDFYRTWKEYADGFGDLLQEHWIGNDKLLRITNCFMSSIRGDLKLSASEKSYFFMQNFKLTNEKNYAMYYQNSLGPAGDAMSNLREKGFSTKDGGENPSAAQTRHGGWWYINSGLYANLNGKYYTPGVMGNDAAYWYTWKNKKSLKETKIMIRSTGKDRTGELGMRTEFINKQQISSNSPETQLGHEPHNARLNSNLYWAVENLGYYLEINLMNLHRVTHFSSQGGVDLNYVKSFSVQFMNESGYWKDYVEDGQLKIFEGNNERTLSQQRNTVSNCLYNTGLIRKIRFYLVSCSDQNCSLRMELYGCEDSCSSPLGVGNGLPDDRMSASSSRSGRLPEHGRLDFVDSAWCAEPSKVDEFLQINFKELVRVTYVETQGLHDNGVREYVKSYALMYKNRKRKWMMYDKVFQGNINYYAPIRRKIEKPFLALSVRFVVKTWHTNICLRAEIYGCYPDNPKFVILANNAVAGKQFNIAGKYRYCKSCECPGCKKSICLRVFDKVHILAAHFSYDCSYRDFLIPVQASAVPGVHKVYISDSEYSNCSRLSNERVVGSIVLSEGYRNCLDLLLSGHTKSGEYTITPDGEGSFKVYCDQEKYGGGWTVFQRLFDNSENFTRDWASYKKGFGDLERNFWLGNDFIHRLTTTKRELLLDLNSENGDHAFVLYKSFQVNNEDDNYRLSVSEYQESVGHCFQHENGKEFSTYDRDNDRDNRNCAVVRGAGWWYSKCGSCRLNGDHTGNQLQLKFDNWPDNRFLDWVEMKIRPKDVVTCNENFCYYLLKKRQQWFPASEECRRFHADLLSIHDASENEWIANTVLSERNIEEVHLGMHNASKWTDGSKVLFQNFANSYSSAGCPVLQKDGSWLIKACNETRTVLCKRGKSCFKGQCYIYNPENLKHENAQNYCQDHGYDLVKISSKTEQNSVMEFIHASTQDSSFPSSVWLGLKRFNDSSFYFWVDGSPLDFNLWFEGEPNEPDEKFCTKLESDGSWKDCKCTTSFSFPCEKDPNSMKPKDCLELLLSGTTRSGIYSIDPDGLDPFQVYCDQENMGGGWTVLMRQVDRTEYFNRTWEEYKNGFGSLDRNFWLGNELMHRLTSMKQEAVLDIQSNQGDNSYVLYKNFKVDSEEQKYKLTIDEYETSDRGDSMAECNGMFFTTKDRDNDEHGDNCADISNGGWWHRSCAAAFLTGTYESSNSEFQMRWDEWILSGAEMKIRRKSFVRCQNNFCHYHTGKKRSWLEALEVCRNFNAEPAFSRTGNVDEYLVTNLMSPHGLDKIYLGLGMGDTDAWTHGGSLGANRLNQPLPVNKCVALTANEEWEMVDCEESKFVVCTRAKNCYQGDCYFRVGTEPRSYNETITGCTGRGSKLPKISSKGEHLYVMKILRLSTSDSSIPSVFTGLRLVGSDFQWEDGSKLQYFEWSDGEPTGGGEYLTVINTQGFVDIPDSYTSATLCERGPVVKSCAEVTKYGRSDSGFYFLHMGSPKLLTVYCDLSSSDGPWTVIQRRVYNKQPSDYQSKTWDNYRNGFGESEPNFWLGNKYIHELTKTSQRLKIILYTDDFNVYEAIYEDFTVGDEASKFVINFGAYSGTAGDSLSSHRGMKFSTVDQDNDENSGAACTDTHSGGWWFSNCLKSNLNGAFAAQTNSPTTLYWETILRPIIRAEMKIQSYNKRAEYFVPDGLIQSEITSLGLTFYEHTMKINMKTSDQHWTVNILRPGPFLTQMTITWEDNSYLRYYENGTLLAEVSAKVNSRLTYSNTTNFQYAWLNKLALFDKQLTKPEVKTLYGKKILEFEEDRYLWNLTDVPNYNWNIIRGCTPSNFTGPCGDHTYLKNTGSFAYTEASRPAVHGDRAYIKTPNLLGIYNCLTFWYHTFGNEIGSLNVYLTTNYTTFDISLRNISGNSSNHWRYSELDINIDTVFKIVFEATRGDGYRSDIAIDDIILSAEKCKKECYPPCGVGERCNNLTVRCEYKGIYDYRWTLNSFNDTNTTALSVNGQVEETEGAMEGALEFTGASKIIFKEFNHYCNEFWCFLPYTLSFWLKYEDVTSQDILALGDFVRVTQTSSTPTDHVSIALSTSNKTCQTSFFVPTEVWSHIIIASKDESISIYLDGRLMESSTTLQCTLKSSYINEEKFDLVAGGSGDVNFNLDDVRLLFDVQLNDTLHYYKEKTGHQQTMFIQAKLKSETWNDDLLNDESDAYMSLSQLIQNKIMETMEFRSNLTEVVIEQFSVGSVVADVTLVYDNIYYHDILLVEEALFVNSSFNGLPVEGLVLNSTSVPNFSPNIITAISPDYKTLVVNWTDVSSLYLNGIFQGYKLLYHETENASYTNYTVEVFYGNQTEFIITNLEALTNYTLRILVFTLSGDGFLSDTFTAITLDGPVTDSPNVSLANVSSTVLYVNWTILPRSTEIYRNLLGYYISYWKQSDINNTFVLNITANSSLLIENLEKWTEYCFNVSGYTNAGVGPASETTCTRTMEDAPEQEPSNVTLVDVQARSIELLWSPPPAHAVPGILRFYNVSYRLLNVSNSEIEDLTREQTSYTINDLNPYSLYELNISAFTVASGPAYSVVVMTSEAEPSALPGNVSLKNLSSTALEVNWTALPKPVRHGIIRGYHLFMWKKSEGSDTSFNITLSSTAVYKLFEDLSKWTVYCIQMTAFTSVGDGPRSDVQCVRTFEDAPEEPPSDFTAGPITVSSIELQWLPPPINATPGIIREYNLTYRNLNYTDDQFTDLNFDASVNSHSMENLIGLTLYEINITSSTILFGPWDSILVLTLEGVPYVAPPNVSWYNLSSTSLQVKTNEIPPFLRNGILLGYRIYLWKQSEGQSSTVIGNISAAESSKVFEGLEKYTFYCGQVVGYTRIGEGPRSPVECFRTSEDAPEVSPVNLNTTNITWSSFYLTWDPIDANFIPGILRSYRITFKITDPEFSQFNGAYDRTFLVDSQATSVNVTGLIGWTNYEVMVNGVTIIDGPGNFTYLKTKEGVPTAPPDEISATDKTDTTITVGWREIFLPERHGIITKYELTYQKTEARSKRDAEIKTMTFDSGTFTAFLFMLTPYTNYTITIAGLTSKGIGPKGVKIIETAEGTPSISPKNSYGVNFTGPTSIFLGWGPLTTAELQGRLVGYKVRYQVFSVADEIVYDPPPEVLKIVYSDINGIKITGLSTYTTYKVSVAAISGGGTGAKSGTLYIATCRCFKRLTTSYWNYQPYTNITNENYFQGFFPYLLDMVTLSCCQNCLEHGTSEVIYDRDGEGNPALRDSDIDVKRKLSLSTDFSFPVYGFDGQERYSKYYGYAAVVEVVGTVFFTKKPEYGSTQGFALLEAVISIFPLLAIAVVFAYIAGVIMWALEHGHNEDEFPQKFLRGAVNGFWWAYISMTTVGYGDKTARTIAGRLFALIWVLMGLVITSLLIGTICTAFTSRTIPPKPSPKMLYGAKIGALHDSPDHKLGVRRTSRVNTMKHYRSLESLHNDLLNGSVDGVLIDTYTADSRRDLFSDSRLLVKQIIDMKASYGVVMGEDATKLRKCFVQFWKENGKKRDEYIKANVQPVVEEETSVQEVMSETFNPTGYLFIMTLLICLCGLCLGCFCGCVYEIKRRNKMKTKVEPEVTALPSSEHLKNHMLVLLTGVRGKIRKLQAKHTKEIIKFAKMQKKTSA